jgi:hypothetical protein
MESGPADGTKFPGLALPENTHSRGRVGLSPDGTRAAWVVAADGEARAPEDLDKPRPFQVLVVRLDKPAERKAWDLPATDLGVCWTADGKKVVAAKVTSWSPVTFENTLLDPETGKTEKLDLPDRVRVLDRGRDGKAFLVETRGENKPGPT